MLIFVMLIFAAAAVVWVTGKVAEYRAYQLAIQEALREECYDAAERIIEDPHTPQEIVSAAHKLIKALPSRIIMARFLWHALTGQLHGRSSLQEDLGAIAPYLRDDFLQMWLSGIFALTYNNLVIGALIRRLMFYGIPPKTNGDIGNALTVGPVAYELAHSA